MNKQIVLNEKFKEHMVAHNSFYNNYEDYLTDEVKEKLLSKCVRDFNIIHIPYSFNVGKVGIVQVADSDNIFWAKRKGRDIYSRFVKNRQNEESNIITFILKEQYHNKGKFNLISMYPSLGKSEKEIFDPNISSLEELQCSISFWSKYAFVEEYEVGTDEDIIEVNKCLYNKEYNSNHNEIIPKAFHQLYLKNLYFGSEITKAYDENFDFIETKCNYTGFRFNYMTNGYEFKIGYVGNEKNDFVEELHLVG